MRVLSFFISLFVLLMGQIQAATYKIDPVHSNIEFTIRHITGKVNGTFDIASGTITVDDKKPTQSSVDAAVNVQSINTRNADRDKHLKSPDFFDSEQFPMATFKSSKLVKKSADNYELHGQLTLHGATKDVKLSMTHLGEGTDPWGNVRSAFSATTRLNRLDYGVKWNSKLPGPVKFLGKMVDSTVGEDVDLEINVEAIKEKEPEAPLPPTTK